MEAIGIQILKTLTLELHEQCSGYDIKFHLNSPIHVGRHFRKFALKSRFIQNFELGKNNWSLQMNGRISKSRFTKIAQSRFIFEKVALFKILNYGRIIGNCR